MAKKPAKKPNLGHKLTAAIMRLIYGVLRMVDIRLVALAGRGIGYLTWAALPGRRRIVARNLRIAIDPTLRGKALSKLVRQNIVRTCENMVCTFKTGLLSSVAQQNTTLEIKGRHDPCIVQRAVPCIEAAAAVAISQLVF